MTIWQPNSCTTYLLVWLGLAPCDVILTGLTVTAALWLMPHDPDTPIPITHVCACADASIHACCHER